MTENSRYSAWLVAFWQGLTGTNFGTFVGAIVFAVLELVACCVAFAPRRFARYDPRYLMDSPGDEYFLLSVKLAKLRYSHPDTLHVAYLGASQATRALQVRDPEAVGRILSRASGRRVSFDMLTGNGQRFEDALIMSDQLPKDYRGVWVLTVNDYKDDYRDPKNVQRERLAVVDAPSVRPFWAQQGYQKKRVGIFFLDNLKFFAARRFAAVRFGPATPKNMGKADEREKFEKALEQLKMRKRRRVRVEAPPDEPMADDELKAIAAQRKASGIRAPILTKSRAVMMRMIKNLEARNIRVVFLENAEMPERNAAFPLRVQRFRDEFQSFSDAMGCTYWDFNPDLDFVSEDFQDTVHLGSRSARRKFQKMFTDYMATFIRTEFPSDPKDEYDPATEDEEDSEP